MGDGYSHYDQTQWEAELEALRDAREKARSAQATWAQQQMENQRNQMRFYEAEIAAYGIDPDSNARIIRILKAEIEEQRQEIEKLKNSINRLKGGKNMKDNALAIVASQLAEERENSLQTEDLQVRAKRDLARKKRFIKKALGKTDDQIKKTKVKDLQKVLILAQDEITVGGMEDLLDEDTKESGGFIKGVLKIFLKAIGK